MAANGSLTFRRRRIIKRKSVFQRVYLRGKSYSGRYFFLRVMRRGPEYTGVNKTASAVIEPSRLPTMFAVAAGKKLGGAVVRNRVKRLLREALRLEQNAIISGLYILLVGRPAATGASLKEVRRELSYFCRKARIAAERGGKT